MAREDERIGNTIPMPTFATRPPTMCSFVPVDIPQSSMFGKQGQQISELQLDKISTPSTFSCWKIRFKTKKMLVPVLPRSNVMDQGGGDVRFNGGIEVIAVSSGQEFPDF